MTQEGGAGAGSPPPAPGATGSLLHRAARALAGAGGALMVGLALLVTLSVLMRWLAGQGISGDFELVQMGLALSVFAFFPICQARRGNVVVDSFTSRLPERAQAALDALWDVVFAAFAGFIAWRLALGAQEAFASGTTSMVLGMPIGHAIGAGAAMMGFLSLTCVATAVERLGGRR